MCSQWDGRLNELTRLSSELLDAMRDDLGNSTVTQIRNLDGGGR
jgi:hypothetical protein